MKSKLAVILGAAVFSLLTSGCATTPTDPAKVAQAQVADKPVTRPYSGVGSYGGYTYRRFE